MNSKGVVYISGPITSDLENYHGHFHLAKHLVREAGYTALSPDSLPWAFKKRTT